MKLGIIFWIILFNVGVVAFQSFGDIPYWGSEKQFTRIDPSKLTNSYIGSQLSVSEDSKYVMQVFRTNNAEGLIVVVALSEKGRPETTRVIFSGERSISIEWSPEGHFFFIQEDYDPNQNKMVIGKVEPSGNDLSVYWIYETLKPRLNREGYAICNCIWRPVAWDIKHGLFSMECKWDYSNSPQKSSDFKMSVTIPIFYDGN